MTDQAKDKTVCPICGQSFTVSADRKPHLPFCSDRCRAVDLGRWFDERYAVPVTSRKATAAEEPEVEPTE